MTLVTHPDVRLTPIKREHQPPISYRLSMAWCEDEPIFIHKFNGRWVADFDGHHFTGAPDDDVEDVANSILDKLM